VLLAFVDASWDKNRQVVSVAGFLGVSSAWCAFQEHWQGVRNRWGLKFLRMTEFMSSHGEPYATWSAAQRNALVSELTDLINKHLLCGTVVSLNLTDYYALSDEDRWFQATTPLVYVLPSASVLWRPRLSSSISRSRSSTYLKPETVASQRFEMRCGD
jgi:hypothetical protein